MTTFKRLLVFAIAFCFLLVATDALAQRKKRKRRSHDRNRERDKEAEVLKVKREWEPEEDPDEATQEEQQDEKPVLTIQPMPEAQSKEASSDGKVKLSWGSRMDRQVLLVPDSPAIEEKTEYESEEAEWNQKTDVRGWRFRIILPQFISLWGPDDFHVFGTEQGFQIEIAERHIITMVGNFGFDNSFLAGGGAGYAFELHIVEDVFFLELGGTLGFHYREVSVTEEDGSSSYCVEWDDWGNCVDYDSYGYSGDDEYEKDGFTILTLRPTLHIGYKWIFLSVGPRMGIGNGVIGGIQSGLMLRF